MSTFLYQSERLFPTTRTQPSEALGTATDKQKTFIPEGRGLLLFNSAAFMHFPLILPSFDQVPRYFEGLL